MSYSADSVSPLSLPPKARLWQLMVTGPGAAAVSAAALARLAHILDRMPEVPFLTVATVEGEVVVQRDFPGYTWSQVDGFLVGLFADQPELLGVTFPALPVAGQRKAHTATPEAPYASALTQRLAEIQAACENGTLSEAEALEQIEQAAREG